MNPATIMLILEGLQAAVSAAPKVAELVTSAHALIDGLFTAKAISADVQNALHKSIDARAALALAGVMPDAFKVRPDPQ